MAMARFMIVESHDAEHRNRKRTVESLRQAGSYFLTHAQWCCANGDHIACLTLEADSEAEVQLLVPPILRARAKVVRLS
jgi:hypothetical protein